MLDGRAMPRSALLKLDVQRFPLDALAGATNILAMVEAWLDVAVEHASHYQPLFEEVHARHIRGR
ncbi:MAG: hypothetical protein LC808_22940 [Actinobacteria bacterium]|nr:hypothetical protein [Actinomycetota bacterium]